MLLTWHNISYYQGLMAGLRGAILAGDLERFDATTREGWRSGDELP